MSKVQIAAMTASPEKDFETWWYNEGSGMPPKPDEDAEEHCYRVAKIAWLNGDYKGNQNDCSR
jgi:hypothetical protein